jgi:hypothetical protein
VVKTTSFLDQTQTHTDAIKTPGGSETVKTETSVQKTGDQKTGGTEATPPAK